MVKNMGKNSIFYLIRVQIIFIHYAKRIKKILTKKKEDKILAILDKWYNEH